MTYRLAIFDFDGTLADTFPWFVSVLNDVADRFGFRRVETEAEVTALRGMRGQEIMKYLEVPPWKVPLIARHMRRLASQDVENIRLFPGILPMLEHLRSGGVRLAVVTSNTEENVRRVLGPDGAARFEQYACGASLFGKASRFRQVLKLARVKSTEAICIGDEMRDGEAAATVGIPFGAVSWGFSHLDALMRCSPREVFASVEEIATTLTSKR
ncbi:MAG TPA: HAD hydrolase-like protein [Labilithrix sp.]|nr:HAD hydrolase-like protein [Labilithrix sp.]